jgi:hypothetical protein
MRGQLRTAIQKWRGNGINQLQTSDSVTLAQALPRSSLEDWMSFRRPLALWNGDGQTELHLVRTSTGPPRKSIIPRHSFSSSRLRWEACDKDALPTA